MSDELRVLVTGSRDWTDKAIVSVILNGFFFRSLAKKKDLVVIEGGANGADKMAKEWEVEFNGHGDYGYSTAPFIGKVSHETFPADWDAHGKAAGHIRNKEMFDESNPDVVIAFKDDFDETLSGGGTENMVSISKDNVPTYLIKRIR